MRAMLGIFLLLVLLGVGLIQADRGSEPRSLVLAWIAPEAPPPEATPDAGERIEAPPPAARSAVGAIGAQSVLAAGELSVLEPDRPEPMVRYLDAEGSLHMVRGRSRVPERYRADAVELGRGNVNVVSIPAPSATAFRDWQPEASARRARVVLFSASWCGACQRAKRYLDEQGVAYRERDIDADSAARQEVARVLGRIAVPLLDVDGRYISGFRPDVYERALGRG
jgi:glutaredoxin